MKWYAKKDSFSFFVSACLFASVCVVLVWPQPSPSDVGSVNKRNFLQSGIAALQLTPFWPCEWSQPLWAGMGVVSVVWPWGDSFKFVNVSLSAWLWLKSYKQDTQQLKISTIRLLDGLLWLLTTWVIAWLSSCAISMQKCVYALCMLHLTLSLSVHLISVLLSNSTAVFGEKALTKPQKLPPPHQTENTHC